MKRNGFFSFLAGLGFLLPVLYLFFQIRSLALVRFSTQTLGILTVQAVCTALLALRLLTNWPLNKGLALLTLICALTHLLIFLEYRGGFRLSNLLNVLAWALLTLSCILAGAGKSEFSLGKKALMLLPTIFCLFGSFFELRNGVLRLVIGSFHPNRLQSWALLHPFGLAAGFLFFALWLISGSRSIPGEERRPRPAPAGGTTSVLPTQSEDRMVQQYRGFLASGIITQEEFDAKMRSLGKK